MVRPRFPGPMRRSALAIALWVTLLLPFAARAQGAPAPAIPRTGAFEGERVADVRVQGVRRVEADAVRNAMRTRPGDVVDRDRIREDLRRIFALGFFEDVRIDAERAPEGLRLIVTVDERPAIRQVRIEGNDEISTEDLREGLDVRPFQVLDVAAVRRNLAKIQEKYVEQGYYLAVVDYRIVELPDEEVDVVFEIRENAKVVVESIEFLGNERISDDELKEQMITREGDFLSFLTGSGIYREELFQRDMAVAQAVYYDHGYINVRFGDPVVALTPDLQRIHITIPVEEGEQFSIGSVEFSGDLIAEPEALRRLVETEPGQIFSRSRLQGDIQALTNLYQDEAYAYVNVTPLTSVNAEDRTVDLTFDIQKGKKVRWERIEIVGNEKTRDKVIRRELRIYEGDLFNGSALQRSKQRVTALGFFEPDPQTGLIRISTRRGSTDELIVAVVEVKERPTGTFQVGAGFSSVENFIATAQVSQTNFFGWGQSASLSAQISSLRQLIQLQFVEPYFFDTNWTFAFDFFRTEADYGTFIRESTGGSLTFGHPLPLLGDDQIRGFVTYTLEDVAVTANRAGDLRLAGLDIFGSGVTSSLRFSINWDTRNNRLFPSRGFMQSASVEIAPSWLLSEIEFTRWTGITRWYFPLPAGLVFKTQGTVGWITSPDGQVPISERYFLGGINSVRGYVLRSISPGVPYLPTTDPASPTRTFSVGGTKQLILNTELEVPLLEAVGIRGVLFYDIGNTWPQDEPLFGDSGVERDLPLGLFHSTGFGFRWFSPIGPLRFEWGIPLTPRPEDEGILFEFTIGNSF